MAHPRIHIQILLFCLSIAICDAYLSSVPSAVSTQRYSSSSAFVHISTKQQPHHVSTQLFSSKDEEEGTTKEKMNPVTKASWYAAEALGKLFAPSSSSQKASVDGTGKIDLTQPPSTLNEALERIKLDNDRSYFLSGQVDVQAYSPDCIFADPFVSFAGRDRFVDNLANLGSFITNYSAKMINYEVLKDGVQVQTKVVVKLELNLPWKPILAWPWGVRYDIDPESNLIVNHVESWDIEPWEGVKQVFRKPMLTI
uniref:SnoaL-like domain-containing protein n=1 Tax=Ditylum brightwellii TaxID=49249 RepID=A0A7S2E7S9_9STRA